MRGASTRDLRHAKNQQWLNASYIIALEVAMITFITNNSNEYDAIKNIIYIVCIGVALLLMHFGIYLALNTKKRATEYRSEINKLILRPDNGKQTFADYFYLITFIIAYVLLSLTVVALSLMELGVFK